MLAVEACYETDSEVPVAWYIPVGVVLADYVYTDAAVVRL